MIKKVCLTLASLIFAFNVDAQSPAGQGNSIKVAAGSTPQELVANMSKMVTGLTADQKTRLLDIYTTSLAAVLEETAAIGNLAQQLTEEMAKIMAKGEIDQKAIEQATKRIQAKAKAYMRTTEKIRAKRDAQALTVLKNIQKDQYKTWLKEEEAKATH